MFETEMSEWIGALMAMRFDVLLTNESEMAMALFKIPVVGQTEALVVMYLKMMLMNEFKEVTPLFEIGISGLAVICLEMLLPKSEMEMGSKPAMNKSDTTTASFEIKISKWIGTPVAMCLKTSLVNELEIAVAFFAVLG